MDPWECPRCHTINAGWVAQCTCKPTTATVADANDFLYNGSVMCDCPISSGQHTRGPGCYDSWSTC